MRTYTQPRTYSQPRGVTGVSLLDITGFGGTTVLSSRRADGTIMVIAHPPIVVARLITTTMGTSTRKGPAGDRRCHASIPGSSAVVTM